MPQTLPISKARSRLLKIARELSRHPEHGAVTLTNRGKAVLTLMSSDLYESVIETMEVMSDKKLMADFRKGVKELKQGRGIPWEKVKADLGL
jgi:PHD/YefM family antitoxin component YafN of YafNO toxin-antitoxin module